MPPGCYNEDIPPAPPTPAPKVRSAPTPYQRRRLEEWYYRFTGQKPAEVPLGEMVKLFLDPPPQWSRLANYGAQHIRSLDNPDTFSAAVRSVMGVACSPIVTPVITVRVLCYELDCAVRGELLLLPGWPDDRLNLILIQQGSIELITEQRLPGPPFRLGTCPTPQEIAPKGRSYLDGKRVELQKERKYPRVPKTLDGLIPDELELVEA